MITTLSFTIHGTRRAVSKRAQFWMSKMGIVMGKTIAGTTLVETSRKDHKETLPQLKRRQLKSMFNSSQP